MPMRRADRLFDIIRVLRAAAGPVTAAALAEELEVPTRTIYRDIATMQARRTPIEGEAGVGYVLRRGFDLPPLMFTEPEIEAMVLGARGVTSWADAGLAKAASEAVARVEGVLPDRLRERLTGTPLYAPGFHVPPSVLADLATMRAAIEAHRKAHFAYTSGIGGETERSVRPLGLFFWGSVWSLTAWCELREDFRSF